MSALYLVYVRSIYRCVPIVVSRGRGMEVGFTCRSNGLGGQRGGNKRFHYTTVASMLVLFRRPRQCRVMIPVEMNIRTV